MHSNKKIWVANKEKSLVFYSQDVLIVSSTDNCEYEVTAYGQLGDPSLTAKSSFVDQLIAIGNGVVFIENGRLILCKTRILLRKTYLFNAIYKLNITEVLLAAVTMSGDVWHQLLEL